MSAPPIARVAVLGGGIIGRSWALTYARAGCEVAIFQHRAASREALPGLLTSAMDSAAPLAGDAAARAAALARIRITDGLEAALDGAGLVHECAPERLELKRALMAAADLAAAPEAILASATSSFPVSTWAAELPGRARCIVAHPATPPHLLPVTEVCPAPFTDPAVTRATVDFLTAVGQVPVLIEKERPGFVLNRMQAALVVEMLRAVGEGVISAEGADRIISSGFGLRWSVLGPLEGVDLNAPGGIRDYLARFGFLFDDKAAELGLPPVLTPETVDRLEAYARVQLPLDRLPEAVAWRDRALAEVRALVARLAAERPGV